MIEYVDLESARTATGVRMVVAASVPSPWSEAAKGLFRIAGIPVLAVRHTGDVKDINAWTGIDNAPVVFHGAEPPRASWAAIVGLAARLAPGAIAPVDPGQRAELFGALELIAGDQGLGWSARLVMIHVGLETAGKRGFSVAIAQYLARRYGYAGETAEQLRERVAVRLAWLRDRLAGRDYFGGAQPNALDVYTATFLTPVSPLTDEACPQFRPSLRPGFAAAAEELGPLVPVELAALRTRMLERHLGWPIAL